MSSFYIYKESLIQILAILVICVFLFIADTVIGAEIKDFSFNSNINIDSKEIKFKFGGTLHGSPKDSILFWIFPRATYSPEYNCSISGHNCKFSNFILGPVTTGPIQSLQPDGSWKIVNNTRKTEKNSEVANSWGLISIPEGSDGEFFIEFALKDIVKKRNELKFFSRLELDEKEQYFVEGNYLLRAMASLNFDYYTIKVPKHFILNENSGFSYDLGNPKEKEYFKFKKIGDETYTLENVSYSMKPYIKGLTIPGGIPLSLKLNIERSSGFIKQFNQLAFICPFIFLIGVFFEKMKTIESILLKTGINFSPLLIYIYFRNRLVGDFSIFYKQDLYFIAICITIFLVVFRTSLITRKEETVSPIKGRVK